MKNIDEKMKELLINKAIEARENSYSPFSSFSVGAALLCSDGEIIVGTNVENSSFGGTICAERSAFCAAVSQGKREFDAIAIVGGKRGEKISENCAPCGICRQFMNEFCNADFIVLLSNGESITEKTLGSLLPDSFKL